VLLQLRVQLVIDARLLAGQAVGERRSATLVRSGRSEVS
jgi:hypothetical protein